MLTVGVDLGGTNVLAMVVDDQDEILGSSKMRTPQTGDRGSVLEVMGACVHDAVGSADAAIPAPIRLSTCRLSMSSP